MGWDVGDRSPSCPPSPPNVAGGGEGRERMAVVAVSICPPNKLLLSDPSIIIAR